MQMKRVNPVRKKFSVTVILLLTNIVFFVFSMLLPNIFAKLRLVSGTLLSQPWTIFTSMFMHSGFAHLFFNMYALLMFGTLIEQRIGRKRFLISYVLAGIVAAIAFNVYNVLIGQVGVPAVGASGAIMGILGLTIMLLPEIKVLFFFVIPMSMRTAGIIFALIDLFGLFNPTSNIAHIAHLGGLVVGLLLGWYFKKKKKDYQQKFMNVRVHHNKPKPNYSSQNYERDIELTKDDMDNYFKYGKL